MILSFLILPVASRLTDTVIIHRVLRSFLPSVSLMRQNHFSIHNTEWCAERFLVRRQVHLTRGKAQNFFQNIRILLHFADTVTFRQVRKRISGKGLSIAFKCRHCFIAARWAAAKTDIAREIAFRRLRPSRQRLWGSINRVWLIKVCFASCMTMP